MTGPEHYRAAEKFLERAQVAQDPEWTVANAVVAQVHATLANAAAMVDATNETLTDFGDWRAAQAPAPEPEREPVEPPPAAYAFGPT